MKISLTILAICFSFISKAQIPTPSCDEPVEVCDSAIIFPPSTNGGQVYPFVDLWQGFWVVNFYHISIPASSPTTPGLSCAGLPVNNYYVKLTVDGSGYLEFFMVTSDYSPYWNMAETSWYLYPFTTSTCSQIQSNLIPPVSCNLEASYPYTDKTGMVENQAQYPGTNPVAFEPSVYANAGDEFLLLIHANIPVDTNTNIPIFTPKLYVGNAIPGNESSTTTATFTCEPWTVPQSICLGDSVWFELGNSYNAYDSTYTYTFLNDANDVVNSNHSPWFQVMPDDTTTYHVEVSKNGVIYDTLQSTVYVTAPATPNAGVDQYICEGDTAFLQGALSDSTNYFEWQILDNNDYISATDTLNVDFFSTPDTSQLILLERNHVCIDGIDTVNIFTHPTPILELFSDTSICVDGSASLLAEVSNVDSLTYHWSFTNSLLAQQDFQTNTDTWVSVYASDTIGCTSETDSVFISVKDSLDLNTTSFIEFCAGEYVQLNTNTNGGLIPYNFNWIYEGTNVNISDNYIFSPLDEDSILVIVNDACETPSDSTWIVLSAYDMPNVGISPNDTLLCFPGKIEFTYNTSIPLQNSSWIFGDGQVVNNQNQTLYTYSNTGVFEAYLTYNTADNCSDSSNLVFIEVIENPEADFSFNADITEYSTQVLFNNNSRNALDYYWIFDNGTPNTSTLERPTVNFPEGEIGEYQITLYAYNQADCMDSISKMIKVATEYSIFAPNTFTPNGDQSNNTWSIATNGIDKQDFQIQIFNRWGKLIFESQNPNFSWDGIYNGKIVPTGIYTWQIELSTSLNAERKVERGLVNVLY